MKAVRRHKAQAGRDSYILLSLWSNTLSTVQLDELNAMESNLTHKKPVLKMDDSRGLCVLPFIQNDKTRHMLAFSRNRNVDGSIVKEVTGKRSELIKEAKDLCIGFAALQVFNGDAASSLVEARRVTIALQRFLKFYFKCKLQMDKQKNALDLTSDSIQEACKLLQGSFKDHGITSGPMDADSLKQNHEFKDLFGLDLVSRKMEVAKRYKQPIFVASSLEREKISKEIAALKKNEGLAGRRQSAEGKGKKKKKAEKQKEPRKARQSYNYFALLNGYDIPSDLPSDKVQELKERYDALGQTAQVDVVVNWLRRLALPLDSSNQRRGKIPDSHPLRKMQTIVETELGNDWSAIKWGIEAANSSQASLVISRLADDGASVIRDLQSGVLATQVFDSVKRSLRDVHAALYTGGAFSSDTKPTAVNRYCLSMIVDELVKFLHSEGVINDDELAELRIPTMSYEWLRALRLVRSVAAGGCSSHQVKHSAATITKATVGRPPEFDIRDVRTQIEKVSDKQRALWNDTYKHYKLVLEGPLAFTTGDSAQTPQSFTSNYIDEVRKEVEKRNVPMSTYTSS